MSKVTYIIKDWGFFLGASRLHFNTDTQLYCKIVSETVNFTCYNTHIQYSMFMINNNKQIAAEINFCSSKIPEINW